MREARRVQAQQVTRARDHQARNEPAIRPCQACLHSPLHQVQPYPHPRTPGSSGGGGGGVGGDIGRQVQAEVEEGPGEELAGIPAMASLFASSTWAELRALAVAVRAGAERRSLTQKGAPPSRRAVARRRRR